RHFVPSYRGIPWRNDERVPELFRNAPHLTRSEKRERGMLNSRLFSLFSLHSSLFFHAWPTANAGNAALRFASVLDGLFIRRRSIVRPRWMRDRTVPMEEPITCAISS